MAQLLAYSAMLRSWVVKQKDRVEVVRELWEISGARKYLLLPIIKLPVEHFLGKCDKDLVTIIINAININLSLGVVG